jgi:spore maturation protein A
MLNYIWAGLIVVSLVFALVTDFGDLRRDTFRNGQPLAVTLRFPSGYQAEARTVAVSVSLDPAAYQAHYDTKSAPSDRFEGTLVQLPTGRQLRFAKDVSVPEPLATIRKVTSARDNDLRGTLGALRLTGDTLATATITFAPVRFVKLQAITQAALDMAETAVELALGLIGAICLWMGLMQIAEASGILHQLVRFTQPLLRPLFPDLPKDHPAMGYIVLNLTANMLGLGNAATPMGLKAMEALQELNPKKDTATNAMVMLLAINTASVQIIPPVLLVAIMGLQVNAVYFPILIVTALSLLVAIVAVRVLGRLKWYREDQQDAPPPPAT